MPKVTLITHTPDPEMTIASAARLCYSPATIAQVQEKLTPERPGNLWRCWRAWATRAP